MIGEGWAKERAALRRYYHVGQDDFLEMDELQATNLLVNLDSLLERESKYLSLAMWGKGDGGKASARKKV